MTSPTPSQQAIERQSKDWPRSPGGYKVACPCCGATGYPTGRWTHAHLEHRECPDCGKTLTKRGLGRHRRMHR